MTVNIYTEISSKAPKVTVKKYGYVLECNIKGEHITRVEFGKEEGSYYKVELIALNEALKRVKPGNEVVIHSDNKFVLSMMEKQLKTWADNNFLKASGQPVANADEWRQIWENLEGKELHTVLGNHQYTVWILAQMSIAFI